MNWWANRLQEGSAAPKPASQQQPQPQPQQPAPQPTYQRKPPSALEEAHCPSCGSGNYMAAPGSKYQRCYECGYPVVQSGSGVGSVQAEGPVKKATQVEGGGFNPQTIVSRVE